MQIDFSNTRFSADSFFKILPEDWTLSIVPFWNDYIESSDIYTLSIENKIIGGGIVFSKTTPDMMYAKPISDKWFEKGYLYIAFLWIDVNYRGQQLGTLWLQKLIQKYPNQKFWLSIENLDLVTFYKKNGFEVAKKLLNNANEEWIMKFDGLAK